MDEKTLFFVCFILKVPGRFVRHYNDFVMFNQILSIDGKFEFLKKIGFGYFDLFIV